MSAVLPHYKMGPANFQAGTLIYGGQLVQFNSVANPSTDLTVVLGTAASVRILGVAGNDANVIATQSGAANAYGQPLIDISVLTDYVSVYYGHTDIWCWYSGAVVQGTLVIAGATGTVVTAGAAPASDQVVGKCTHPGGVSAAMLTQQIGGQGAASFFLGRVRLTV
jgi:hypothetical protein